MFPPNADIACRRARERGTCETIKMSTVAGLLLDSPRFDGVEDCLGHTESVVYNLAHDLRQPLSAIEAIAYYLEMTLPADQLKARQYLLRLQELVEKSQTILSNAVDTVRSEPHAAYDSSVKRALATSSR